jgi:drug/metabolite transporter (DMT)-like permease
MIQNQSNLKNTFQGFLSFIIWSFGALLAINLKNLPLFQVISTQFLLAFFVNSLLCLSSSNKNSFFKFKARNLIISSLCLFTTQFCYFSAFRLAPAAQVDLINYLWPTMLILFSSLLPGERLSYSYLVASLLCLLGISLLLMPVYGQPFTNEYLPGYLLAFGGAVSWTCLCLYTRYQGISTTNSLAWSCGICGILYLALHLSTEQFIVPTVLEGISMFFIGVFQIALAYHFWEKALKKGHIKLLGLFSYCIPVLSILILIFFGKAPFNANIIAATLLISASPLVPALKMRLLQR